MHGAGTLDLRFWKITIDWVESVLLQLEGWMKAEDQLPSYFPKNLGVNRGLDLGNGDMKESGGTAD